MIKRSWMITVGIVLTLVLLHSPVSRPSIAEATPATTVLLDINPRSAAVGNEVEVWARAVSGPDLLDGTFDVYRSDAHGVPQGDPLLSDLETSGGHVIVRYLLPPSLLGAQHIVVKFTPLPSGAATWSAPVALTVTKPATVTVTARARSPFGTTLAISACVTSAYGDPAGVLTLSVNENINFERVTANAALDADGCAEFALDVSALGLGALDISAHFGGDESWGFASANRAVVILETRPTTVTASAAPATLLSGESTALTAAVTATNLAGNPAVVPGTFRWYRATDTGQKSGTALHEQSSVTGQQVWAAYTPETFGETALVVEFVPDNSHGNAWYLPSTSGVVGVTLERAASRTTVSVSPSGELTAPLTLTAQVTSTSAVADGGLVTFTAAGGPTLTATLTGGRATAQVPSTIADGTYHYVAQYRGSATVDTSTSAPASFSLHRNPAVGGQAPGDSVVIETKAQLQQGASQLVTVEGLAPGETVHFYLYSTPRYLGMATADSHGIARLVFTVPASLEPGRHRVEVRSMSGVRSVWVNLDDPNASLAQARLAATGIGDDYLVETLALGGSLVTLGAILALRRRIGLSNA